MLDLFNVILTDGTKVDLINFLLGCCVVAYVSFQRQQLRSLKINLKEANSKIALLDRHVLLASHYIELMSKRKIIKQAPNGEWSSRQPLNEAD